jgi:hypothetical protein
MCRATAPTIEALFSQVRAQVRVAPCVPYDPTLCGAVLRCACVQRVNRKAMSSLLQSTLEAVVDVDKFPKASVDVNVLVLQVCHSSFTLLDHH